MAKWPNVPAVYGWLSLDRRGQWRLRGDPIAHEGAVKFIGRNYLCDDTGCWFFQNGPQRVYVSLAYTPWVLFLEAADESLVDHCGNRWTGADGLRFWLDDAGNLLVEGPKGPGLLYDQDLATALEWMSVPSGDEDELEAVLDAPETAVQAGLRLVWQGDEYLVGSVAQSEAATRFGYQPAPEPGPDGQEASDRSG